MATESLEGSPCGGPLKAEEMLPQLRGSMIFVVALSFHGKMLEILTQPRCFYPGRMFASATETSSRTRTGSARCLTHGGPLLLAWVSWSSDHIVETARSNQILEASSCSSITFKKVGSHFTQNSLGNEPKECGSLTTSHVSSHKEAGKDKADFEHSKRARDSLCPATGISRVQGICLNLRKLHFPADFTEELAGEYALTEFLEAR